MVDAQAIDFAVRHKIQNQTVSSLKHGLIFHANGRKVIRIEKTAIVDVIGSDPPISQAESLRFDQFMELFEACRVPRCSIDRVHSFLDTSGNFWRFFAQRCQAALVYLLIAVTLGDSITTGFLPCG